MKIHRTTISFPQDIFNLGLAKAKVRGFRGSFSAYLQFLVENDPVKVVAEKEARHSVQERPGALMLNEPPPRLKDAPVPPAVPPPPPTAARRRLRAMAERETGQRRESQG